MMMKRALPKLMLKIVLLFSLLTGSCKKDFVESEVFVDKAWKVSLSSDGFVDDETDQSTAEAMLYLMSNNELHYDIYFTNLAEAQTPSGLYLSSAPPTAPPTKFIDFAVQSFTDNKAKGSVALNDEQREKLLGSTLTLFATSATQPEGFAAGEVQVVESE